MTEHPQRACVVRLTEDAIADLHRLGKKDPEIVRAVFKKMLLLERSPDAGEPLLGALVGFRKLVVGDRHWRIVWRVTADTDGTPILDISEIWAVGARSDSEIYEELKARVARIGDDPKLQPLKTSLPKWDVSINPLRPRRNPPGRPPCRNGFRPPSGTS